MARLHCFCCCSRGSFLLSLFVRFTSASAVRARLGLDEHCHVDRALSQARSCSSFRDTFSLSLALNLISVGSVLRVGGFLYICFGFLLFFLCEQC